MKRPTKHIITLIDSIKILFQLNGLKVEELNSFKTLMYRFIYVFNFLWMNFDASGEIIWFLDGLWSGKEFVILASIIPCLIMCFLGNMKMIFHLLNEAEIDKLIINFQELEDDKFNELSNSEEQSREKIYDKEIKHLNTILKLVKVLNSSTIIVFGLTPLVLMATKYLETKELVPILPLYAKYYFFDPYNMKYYGLIYVRQLWSMCICMASVTGVDMLFCTMCVFIKIHFKLLQNEFESFIPIQAVSREYLTENETIKTRFKSLIEKHKKVISCAKMLNRIHSNEFMLNFITSSFLICLSAFIMSVAKDMRFRVSFFTFLLASLQQLFLLCFFGDMVMTCSIELSDSIYNSSWYLAKSSIGKQLCYILHRSQIPCKITASNFMNVNLVIFTKILSKTWTLFALLRTIFNI